MMIQLSADNCIPEKARTWWGLLVLLLLKHSSNPAQVEAFDCQLAKLQHKYMQIASTSSLINAAIVRTSLLKEDRVIDVGKCNFPVFGAWILTQKPDFYECCLQLEWKTQAKWQTFGPLVTVIVCVDSQGPGPPPGAAHEALIERLTCTTEQIRVWQMSQRGRSNTWGNSRDCIKYKTNTSVHYWKTGSLNGIWD